MSGRWVAGIHSVEEALAAGQLVRRARVVAGEVGPALRRLLAQLEDGGIPVDRVARRDLDQEAPGRHQGIVVELPPFPYAPARAVVEAVVAAGQDALVLACEGIQDPGNLGALIRSAAAFGATAVVTPQTDSVAVTAAAERAAAGAASRLPIARVAHFGKTLDALSEAGMVVIAVVAHGGAPPQALALQGPVCLVLGGEAEGITRGTAARCKATTTIPLTGSVESLNVSVAAGIVLYEVARQRAAR